MYPVLLRIGPVTILGHEVGPLTLYSFGLMVGIAFLTAAGLAARELTRKNLNGDLAWTMMFWAMVGGFANARLFWIFENWGEFMSAPVSSLFGGAGFVWYGGLIGGFVAVSWIIYREKLPWLVTVDCIAPGLVLAHGIGRIGCQLAGDGDWGKETTLPWGMTYPNAIIGWHYAPGVRVHPTPLYELLAYTAIFVFLWSIRKRPHPNGTLLWWYLVLASTARFFVEFIRINDRVVVGLTIAQLTSVALVLIGAWKLVDNRRLLAVTAVPAHPPARLHASKQ